MFFCSIRMPRHCLVCVQYFVILLWWNFLLFLKTISHYNNQKCNRYKQIVLRVNIPTAFHLFSKFMSFLSICALLQQHYMPMPSTSGCLKQPLGLTRLQVTRLVSTLVHTNNMSVAKCLAELGTLGTLLVRNNVFIGLFGHVINILLRYKYYIN